MKKIITCCLTIFFISACGFEPLYVEKKHSNSWYFGGDFDGSISTSMSKIKVENISGRFGQQVRNVLLDSLTPKGVPSNPEYKLFVEPMDVVIEQQALRRDITATREKAKYMVNYQLVDKNNEELVKGNSIAYVSYDILANPYSTTMAKKKSQSDAAKIVANDIALRLGAYFHTVYTKRGTLNDFQTSTNR